MRNYVFAYAKTKTQISCVVTWQLIGTFRLIGLRGLLFDSHSSFDLKLTAWVVCFVFGYFLLSCIQICDRIRNL